LNKWSPAHSARAWSSPEGVGSGGAGRFFRSGDLASPLSFLVFLAALVEAGGYFQGLWNLGAAVLLAAGAVVLARSALKRDMPFPPALAGMALFFFWGVLSGLRSGDPGSTFQSLTKFAAAGVFAILAFFRWEKSHRDFFQTVVIFAASLQALGAIGSFLFSRPLFLIFPGPPQYPAFWLALAAALALGRALAPGQRLVGRWVHGLLSVPLVAGGLLFPSRSGFLSILTGLGLLFLLRFGRRGLGVFVLAAFLFGSLLPLSAWERKMKSNNAFHWRRTDIWASAINGIWEKPFLGWSPGRFEGLYLRHAVPQNMGPVRFRIITSYAHNDFLQLAAEYGLAGAALFLFSLGALVLKRGRSVNDEVGPPAAMGAAAVFCLFNYPLVLPANALLAAGIVACATAPPGKRRASGPSNLLKAVLAATLGLFALGNLAFFAGRWARSRGSERWGRILDPWNVEPLLAEAEGLIHSPRGSPPEAVMKAERILKAVVSRRSDEIRGHQNLAHLASDHKDPPDWRGAEDSLSTAISLFPTNALLHMNLSRILVSSGQPFEALAAAHQALRLEPNCAEAVRQVGALIRARGEPVNAERWLTAALPRLKALQGIRDLPPYPRVLLELHADLFLLEIARCRFDQRRYEKALATLQQAGEMSVNHMHLAAVASHHLGRTHEAEEWMGKALEKDPLNPILAETRRRIRSRPIRPAP